MKKILLASTALVAMGSMAAADVVVSGSGRIGVIYEEGRTTTTRAASTREETIINSDGEAVTINVADTPAETKEEEYSFTSRIRIQFTGSGQTDGGLAFGGSIRADNAAAGNQGTAGSVFISGDFGRITAGDTDGAATFVVGDLYAVGLTEFGDLQEFAYLSNNRTDLGLPARPTVRYDYSISGITLAFSAQNPGSGEEVYSVAAGYATDLFNVGLGYERNEDLDLNHVIGGAELTLDMVSIKAVYGQVSDDGKDLLPENDQYGVSVKGSFDAATVTAYYLRDFFNDEIYGLGAAYDLGGGAQLKAGYNYIDPDEGDSKTVVDFGIAFNF